MPITDATGYPIEITLLIWSVALCVVQVLIAVCGATLQVGLPALAGNRQNLPPFTGWVDRAQRAHRNLLENLPLFAILVLVAALVGRFSESTALGAQLFFWGRVAHAVIFLIGVPYLRTAAWLVSVVGLALIFIALL